METPKRISRLQAWWTSMPNEQRFAVSILSICGIGAFLLSIAQLRNQLYSPFMVSKVILAKAQLIYNEQARQANEEATQKETDTDHDGLSDYAELNIYHTSPYLADTDSDGIPDAIEVAQGTDPTCPKGTQCVPLVEAVPTENAASATVNDLLQIANGGNQTSVLEALQPRLPTPEELQAMSASGSKPVKGQLLPPDQMTPAKIRTYMTDNNLIPPDQLNKLTDSQLTQAYQQAYTYVQQRYAGQ